MAESLVRDHLNDKPAYSGDVFMTFYAYSGDIFTD